MRAVGATLSAVKAEVAHGDFGAWVEKRAGMSQDTAQRAIALDRLLDAYPQIETVSSQLRLSTMYRLAQAKNLPDEAIDKVVAHASANGGEVGDDKVTDIIEEFKPEKKEKKAARLPFTLLPAEIAAELRGRVSALLNGFYGRNTRGLDSAKVMKSPAYKRWYKEFLAGEDSRDLHNLLVVVYLCEMSYRAEGAPQGEPEIIDAEA
jgi:hypothetical protein